MKNSEIKNKSAEELNKMLAEKREAIRKFRFGVAGSRVKDVKEGRNARRDIGRILTELNKK
jgi:ribosomal protein L29